MCKDGHQIIVILIALNLTNEKKKYYDYTLESFYIINVFIL